MKIRILLAAAAFAGLLAMGACGGRRQIYTGMTADSLLSLGMNELQGRHWDKAVQALQIFTYQFPTHDRYQEARFGVAEAYFGKKEFISAAAEYSRLATDYPAGEYADDARFKVCESYSRISPRPQLDQEYTRAAMDHCESLIAYYPDSPFVPRAREISGEMRDKLAEKLFRAGEYYMKINHWEGAAKTFDDTLTRYPGATIAPRALYRMYEAYQELGYREEAEAARERLLRDFPDSQEARRLSSGVPANG